LKYPAKKGVFPPAEEFAFILFLWAKKYFYETHTAEEYGHIRSRLNGLRSFAYRLLRYNYTKIIKPGINRGCDLIQDTF
jgi:hypothetical protein